MSLMKNLITVYQHSQCLLQSITIRNAGVNVLYWEELWILWWTMWGLQVKKLEKQCVSGWMNKYAHRFLPLTVCAVPGLHGSDGKPRVEYGTTGQRRSGWDSRPVHFLHEEPGNQTQPIAASVHTSRTHTPHTDLSSRTCSPWNHGVAVPEL